MLYDTAIEAPSPKLRKKQKKNNDQTNVILMLIRIFLIYFVHKSAALNSDGAGLENFSLDLHEHLCSSNAEAETAFLLI